MEESLLSLENNLDKFFLKSGKKFSIIKNSIAPKCGDIRIAQSRVDSLACRIYDKSQR